MSSIHLKESPMPLVIRAAGHMFAVVHATKAVLFLVIAWAMPTYALRPPPTTISVHRRHVRIRRASVDTTVSETPTLVEDAAEDKLGDTPPKHKVRLEEQRDEVRRDTKRPKAKKKKSQVFSQLSSSVTPVAKRLAAPARRLSASFPKKSRSMVAGAQAKCSSIISNVHDRFPKPLPMKEIPILASCSTMARKITTPVRAETWRSLRKHETF